MSALLCCFTLPFLVPVLGRLMRTQPFACLLIPFPDHPDTPHGAHFFDETYGLQDWLSSDCSFPYWWEEPKGDWELPHLPQKSTAVLFLPPLEGKKRWRLMTEISVSWLNSQCSDSIMLSAWSMHWDIGSHRKCMTLFQNTLNWLKKKLWWKYEGFSWFW